MRMPSKKAILAAGLTLVLSMGAIGCSVKTETSTTTSDGQTETTTTTTTEDGKTTTEKTTTDADGATTTEKTSN